MGVTGYIDFFTTLFGWIAYNGIWSILADTGLAYAPFVAIIGRNVMSGLKAGKDEGGASLVSLKRIQVEVLIAAFVLAFCASPQWPVRLTDMKAYRVSLTCGSTPATVTGGSTGTTYDAGFASLGGRTPKVPIWWVAVINTSNAVTNATVASIPCSADLRSFQLRMANERIKEPAVRQETEDFVRECYHPALAQIERKQLSVDADDVAYLGADYLLNTPGLYDTLYSHDPRLDWPHQLPRDNGYPALAGGLGGHPTCKEWWNAGTASPASGRTLGLKHRLLQQLDPSLVTELKSPAMADVRNGRSNVQIEDDLRKVLLEVNEAGIKFGRLSNDYAYGQLDSSGSVGGALSNPGTIIGNVYNGLAGVAGATALSATHLPKMALAREALPIVQSFLMMAVYILLPFLLLFSGYSVATVGTVSIGLFALRFLDALWGMAYWVDNRMVDAMQRGASTEQWLGMGTAVQTGIVFSLVTSVLYIVLPLVWMVLLSWAGVKVGGGIGALIGKAIEPAERAGHMGGSAAVGAANKLRR